MEMELALKRLAFQITPKHPAYAPEDALQVGLFSLWDAGENVPPAFAYQRARCDMIDDVRRFFHLGRGKNRYRNVRITLPDPIPTDEHPKCPIEENDIEKVDIRLTVQKLMSHLMPREIEVLRLYYGGGLSFRVVGLEMGISQSRAKQLHDRALKKMRKVA